MTKACLGNRTASASPCASLVFALVILLVTSSTASAAGTLLFDNLRAFGSRLSVGDPALQPTNNNGRILDGPKDIGVADLDNDGFADFAAANKDGTVTVYFGLGDARFGSPVHLPTSGTELRGIALADLTGDGKRDIAVGAPYQGQVYLLVNGGSRNFSLTNIAAWVGARDLAAGDFDGDGLLDLAVAGTTNGLAHFHNLGGGVFEVKTNITLIGIDDVDDFPQPAFYLKTFRPPGATKDELAAARAQRNKVYVLAADAQGALAVQNTLTNIGVNALDVGNLLHPATNSAAAPDLIVSHNDRGTLEIHAGVANVTRFSQNTNQQINIPGGPRNVRIVDLDGDGWNDLVVVQQLFSQVLTFRNLAGIFVPTSQAWVGARPREMDIGDFDNDGYPDVAVLNRYSSDVSILTAYPGAVGFRVLGSFYPVDGEVSGLEVRDFNDDGRDDVIQLHRASGEMSVRLAETNGVLGAPTFYGLGLRPMGKVVADVNNDTIPDMITADFTPFITVRLGLGGGLLGPPMTNGLPDPVPTSGMQGISLPTAANSRLFSVEAADFDGDGKVDVTVGFWDCRLGFFKGNGDGTFTFTQAHVLFGEPRAMTAGDYDLDGDLDIVCASLYSKIAVIENHGDLMTTTNLLKNIIETGIYNTSAIKSYDANGDNDLDLLIVGDTGAALYFGGPGLTFVRTTNSVSIPGVNSSSVATADFDGDGYTDIASACGELGCLSILLGSSNGVYTPFLTATVPSSRYLATGDVDGDGLPDLVGTGDALWVALSGHLVSVTNPPPLLPEARSVANFPVINELLAANSSLPLAADGNRNSDWVEIFNGASNTVSFAGWRLVLIETNGAAATNTFLFPTNATLAAGAHQVIVFVDKFRSPFHTGFNLPAEGGTLCLFNPSGVEVNRIDYPPQQSDISYSRFRDGMPSLMACNFPTPGSANGDSGPVPPTLEFEGVDLWALEWEPIRFFARSTDDVGVMGVTVMWNRLDIPNSPTNRLILADDGMSGDGGMLDGLFSGVLPGLPAGAEIQFYLESMDVSEVVVTEPGNPSFAQPGQPVTLYSFAVGVSKPPLEISEVLADNRGGLRDEANGTPDWFEIRNVSTNPVPLTGISVGQKFFGNSERMIFTNVTLAPGQHYVIFADNNPTQSALHAPFKMNQDGDQLVLTGTGPRGSRVLIDTVDFGPQRANVAWARLGPGGLWRQTSPTPRAGNVPRRGWDAYVEPTMFVFGFATTNGFNYVVEHTDNIASTNWTALPAVRGDGLERTVTQPTAPRQFFRVRRQ